MLYLWVCLCVYGTVVAAQFLELYEDDVCKLERGVLWTCKKESDCLGGSNQAAGICSYDGVTSLVCCKPAATPPPSGEKSRAMCKKYAEYVYKTSHDWLTGEEIREDSCGLVEPLIVGGMDAQPLEYPHMALLGYDTGRNKINWFCGGSLISERFVLSAAHCAEIKRKNRPSKYAELVRLGEYNLATTNDNINGLARSAEYRVAERFVHPQYKNSEVYNDIALFKLDKDVESMGEFIRPACLQTEHLFQKTYAIASGWGHTSWQGVSSDILQKVNLTIISRKGCYDSYRDIAQKSANLRRGIDDASMLCTWRSGKDTCQGDSGGPLQIRLKEPYCMYSLIGVTSFGIQCAYNKPGVYTRVSHYIPWIESIVWPN